MKARNSAGLAISLLNDDAVFSGMLSSSSSSPFILGPGSYPSTATAMSSVGLISPGDSPTESLTDPVRDHPGRRPAGRSGRNMYPCPLAAEFRCGDYFTTSGHASRHAKKHTGRKDAICPECSKAFTRKDNMEQHRRTHRNNGGVGGGGGGIATSSSTTSVSSLGSGRAGLGQCPTSMAVGPPPPTGSGSGSGDGRQHGSHHHRHQGPSSDLPLDRYMSHPPPPFSSNTGVYSGTSFPFPDQSISPSHPTTPPCHHPNHGRSHAGFGSPSACPIADSLSSTSSASSPSDCPLPPISSLSFSHPGSGYSAPQPQPPPPLPSSYSTTTTSPTSAPRYGPADSYPVSYPGYSPPLRSPAYSSHHPHPRPHPHPHPNPHHHHLHHHHHHRRSHTASDCVGPMSAISLDPTPAPTRLGPHLFAAK